MKRRLLNLLTAVSLLLCVAACVLWVRTYFAADRLMRTPLAVRPDGFRAGEYTVYTWRGVLSVGAIRHDFDRAFTPAALYDLSLREFLARQAERGERWEWMSRPPEGFAETTGKSLSRWGFLGWTVNTSDYPGHHGSGVGWSTPCWFLLLICSLLPGLRIISGLRQGRRGREGLCPRCGYDLRATPGRCPECGARINARSLYAGGPTGAHQPGPP